MHLHIASRCRMADALPCAAAPSQVSSSKQHRQRQPAEALNGHQQPAADAPPDSAALPTDPFTDLPSSDSAPKPHQSASEQADPTAQPSAAAAAAGQAGSEKRGGSSGDTWVPLQLALGLPLVPEPLNELVCQNAAVRPPLMLLTAAYCSVSLLRTCIMMFVGMCVASEPSFL